MKLHRLQFSGRNHRVRRAVLVYLAAAGEPLDLPDARRSLRKDGDGWWVRGRDGRDRGPYPTAARAVRAAIRP